MSSNHSEHSSNKHSQLEENLLPPRNTKHGKQNDEESDQEIERKKGFPVIQIILYTFLALIAAFLLFWFWQENETKPSTIEPATVTDPAENMLQNGKDSSRETAETDRVIKKENEEKKPIGEAEEKENGGTLQDQENQPADDQSDKGDLYNNDSQVNQDTEVSEQSEEPKSGPKIIAEHIVQPGETFYAITMKYYHSKKYMDYLAKYNGIKNIRNVEAGTKLIIPEKP